MESYKFVIDYGNFVFIPASMYALYALHILLVRYILELSTTAFLCRKWSICECDLGCLDFLLCCAYYNLVRFMWGFYEIASYQNTTCVLFRLLLYIVSVWWLLGYIFLMYHIIHI